MSHDVFESRLAFAGPTPWHRLGRKLPKNATVEEIVEAAQFFKVKTAPLYLSGDSCPAPGVRAVVREDNGQFLAAVGDRYQTVDAEEVARTLVAAAGDVKAVFHVAGLLGANGTRFFLLAELPKVIRVRGDASEIRPYLLGTSAHDGSSPVILMNCATRVVCANTLGVALSEQTNARWSIRHTRSATERLAEAAQGFQQMVLGMERFEELANALAAERFSDADLTVTLNEVMPLPDDGQDHPGLERARSKVIELFDDGTGMGGLRGTAWGAFQSWTEYADHFRSVRGAANSDGAAARLESVWLGGAADLKRRALAAITSQVGINLAS